MSPASSRTGRPAGAAGPATSYVLRTTCGPEGGMAAAAAATAAAAEAAAAAASAAYLGLGGALDEGVDARKGEDVERKRSVVRGRRKARFSTRGRRRRQRCLEQQCRGGGQAWCRRQRRLRGARSWASGCELRTGSELRPQREAAGDGEQRQQPPLRSCHGYRVLSCAPLGGSS